MRKNFGQRLPGEMRPFGTISTSIMPFIILGWKSINHLLLRLIRSKLDVPGNESIDITDERLNVLRRQQVSQLKPVLRNPDYQAFDLDQAFRLVTETASRLKKR